MPWARAPSANQQHVKARQRGLQLPQQSLQTPLPHLSTSLRGTVFFSSRAIRMCSGVMVFMPDRLDSCTDATAGLKTPGNPGARDGKLGGCDVSAVSSLVSQVTTGQLRRHMPLQGGSAAPEAAESRQLTHHLRMLQHCLGLIAEGQVSVWL